MTATVHARFKVRGRTAAEHVSLNEVLLDREIGLETDTRLFKFGDGATAWNDLDYAAADLPGDLAEIGALATQPFGRDLLTLATNAALKALLALTAADVSDFDAAADARITAQKGAALGLTPLDSGGKISSAYLPPIAMTDVFSVASQTAQLALTAEEGDVAIRSDLSKSYIHNGGTAGTMADWSELLTPTDAVLSFNGRTGAITLTSADIIAALGYTPANVAGHLGQFAATTSAQLRGVISDETGTGPLVFADSPTLTGPTLGTASATRILLGNGSAGAPALAFTADTSTGMYRAGAGEFYISSGGTATFGVYSAGALLIAGKRLSFDGGSNTYIVQSATGGSNTLDVVAGGVTVTRWSMNLVSAFKPVWVPNSSGIGGTAGGATIYGAGGGLYTTGAAGTVTALAPS